MDTNYLCNDVNNFKSTLSPRKVPEYYFRFIELLIDYKTRIVSILPNTQHIPNLKPKWIDVTSFNPIVNSNNSLTFVLFILMTLYSTYLLFII